MYICMPDVRRLTRSIPTGQLSKNFRAEACVLLKAARVLNKTETLVPSTVVLTDCMSLLQNLQGSDNRSQVLKDIKR